MFLEEITARTDARVARLKQAGVPRTRTAGPPRPMAEAIRRRGFGVVAECKHRSPSKGWLTDRYDPVAQARGYEARGAAAISVLTEPDFFAGSLEHLAAVREAVGLPVLRKDFLRDPLQVEEAWAWGADAVLVIVRILDGDASRLQALLEAAAALGLDALTEVHSPAELDQALAAGARFVGVNNRDLDSFETRLDFSREMAPRLPPGVTALSESGYRTAEEALLARSWGYRGILVGETLMRGGTLLDGINAWGSR
ncbi:MAG: indole-3-glycerol phosphate synthase TrpC [Firmicutes bacterium]|nr:indole-3-glycerol phosphate synthase TrpC [Bacillota bacterium]